MDKVDEVLEDQALTLQIAAVERDTGLSKDTLRVWERRYGFPRPLRDPGGERIYPIEQVARLRYLKRLLDAGHRPGSVVGRDLADLQRLLESSGPAAARRAAAGAGPATMAVDGLLALVRAHDAPTLRRTLAAEATRLGVVRFVVDVIAPMNAAVGEAWLGGRLEVFEEHLYTEAVQTVLRVQLAALQPAALADGPAVLLATLPDEPHGLGLLMAEAVAAAEGARCISLGVQTPLVDLVRAAEALGSDIVALGFTGCAQPARAVEILQRLREALPARVALWVGGDIGWLRRRPVAGVRLFESLDLLPAALAKWRTAAGGHGGGIPEP